MSSRWHLKRDGPPSQRIAWTAFRVARLPVVIGSLIGVGSGRTTLVAVGSGVFAIMLLAALVVERRERRHAVLIGCAQDVDSCRAEDASSLS